MEVVNVVTGVLPGLASLLIEPGSLRAIASTYLSAGKTDPLLTYRRLSGRVRRREVGP